MNDIDALRLPRTRGVGWAPGVTLGQGNPLVLISGPCVIEGLDFCLELAENLKDLASSIGLPFIFKASFDKANRTSLSSFRGPGLQEGLRILQSVKTRLGVPILTDIHSPEQAIAVAEVADVLQIPAFLSRQTDLLVAAGQTGRGVNIKKAQFSAPEALEHAIQKVEAGGCSKVAVTERGTCFGHNDLVVDMRGLRTMAGLGCPVVLDATHAVQRPSGAGATTGGQRNMVPTLVRAGVAAGVDALFLEVHPEPFRAKSDAGSSWPLDLLPPLLQQAFSLSQLVRSF